MQPPAWPLVVGVIGRMTNPRTGWAPPCRRRGCMIAPMTASTVVPDHPRAAGVIRRALRREATRIREPRRLAAILILAIVFAAAMAGMWARGEMRAATRRRTGRPSGSGWRAATRITHGPVPPVRLRAVDAAAVRPVGPAAVGRRVVRLPRRDDPAAAVVDSLGLHPSPAGDRDPAPDPGVPDRRRPGHRQHQPAGRARAVRGPFAGPSGWADLGRSPPG